MALGPAASWLSRLPFLLLLAFPLVELAAHAASRSGVAEQRDFERAAAHVRAGYREGQDAIAIAPSWADPLLRLWLGDLIDLPMAGRSDLAAYRRLWGLSLRGARPPDAPAGKPVQSHTFGAVAVSLWELGPSPVVYDLTQHVEQARVSLDGRECPRRRMPRTRGGGLGRGTLAPRERFVCDRRRSWLWVAPVVLEDLELQPRYCVWQHAAGREPITVTFDDVPLGDRIVLYGGLYYEHERMREGAPVRARVLVDGVAAGEMTHVDGDGWKRTVVATPDRDGTRGQIALEVTTERADLRSFCWAATVRRGPEAAR